MTEKQKTEWDNVTISKVKTDWIFVIQMLSLGVLGFVLFYQSKVIGMLWDKVDHMELKIDLMYEDSFPLPTQQTNTPPIFENLGINKDGQISE